MRSTDEKVFYFHAAANTLGGFIQTPFPKVVPSQASVSLPSVGGQATVRTGAFNFEELISCRAAYTRVSGQQAVDGSRLMTVTAVVEGLNILQTFVADRLVVNVSVEYPKEGGDLRVSLAGSSFEGLRIGGCEATPRLNSSLLCAAKKPVEYPTFRQTGGEQADRLVAMIDKAIEEAIDKKERADDLQWLRERFEWMGSKEEIGPGRCVLSSLVDGINRPIPGEQFGHALLIPDFGSLFLGEVIVCSTSVRVYTFRAELGCGTSGKVNGPAAHVEGHPYP